jgi:hypothetical protein
MPIWRSDAAIRRDDRGCRITAWGRAFAVFLEFARQISGRVFQPGPMGSSTDR